jgi:hypothetical protein
VTFHTFILFIVMVCSSFGVTVFMAGGDRPYSMEREVVES